MLEAQRLFAVGQYKDAGDLWDRWAGSRSGGERAKWMRAFGKRKLSQNKRFGTGLPPVAATAAATAAERANDEEQETGGGEKDAATNSLAEPAAAGAAHESLSGRKADVKFAAGGARQRSRGPGDATAAGIKMDTLDRQARRTGKNQNQAINIGVHC